MSESTERVLLRPLGTLAPVTGGKVWSGARLDRTSPMSKSVRASVVKYLERFPPLNFWMCATEDELEGKFFSGGGCNLASDGTWYWRLDAVEYIRHYGIRIPDAAIRHFESQDWTAPRMTPEGKGAVTSELARMFPEEFDAN